MVQSLLVVSAESGAQPIHSHPGVFSLSRDGGLAQFIMDNPSDDKVWRIDTPH